MALKTEINVVNDTSHLAKNCIYHEIECREYLSQNKRARMDHISILAQQGNLNIIYPYYLIVEF